MIDFSFRGITDEKDLARLRGFLLSQSLNYRGYEDWVDRCIGELDIEYKQAIVAFSSGHLVGDLIFQPHKSLNGVLEIKNMRIHPSMRRKDFGHFMLKQMESEARKENYSLTIGDMREEHIDMQKLFLFSGFRELESVSLYDPNYRDLIFVKNLN